MFRKMRCTENQLPAAEAQAMLEKMSYGTLAVEGDDGYPYSVPVSYAYKDGRIYFHGAPEGQKIDAVLRQPKVSFSVVEQDRVIPEEFNTLYRSTVVFGRARLLEGEEKRAALIAVLEKYSGDFMEGGIAYVESAWDQVAAVEIQIEHMTGKKGI